MTTTDKLILQGLYMLRDELTRRCQVYGPDTVAGKAYRADLREVSTLLTPHREENNIGA